jgi:enamine deaminase RidA (YjgF/YER057c/UK114 family)
MADAHHVARAHCETFGAARPASTLVQVAVLTPAKALVEIEVTAIIHD